MNTFIELYHFLQKYNNDNIYEWLEDKWEGKDKQESLLRLFAGLGLISKLQEYRVCKGNFNKKTIQPIDTIRDIFYYKDREISLKDKGDSSDLTAIYSTDTTNNLLVTTSKNLNKINIGNLDIEKILLNFEKYKDNYNMTLCICIRNKKEFNIMLKNTENTSFEIKSIIDNDNTIIIDWGDLNEAYCKFKMYFSNNPIENIMDSNKSTLLLKPHQELSVIKTIQMKIAKKDKILWGHIQRSGKSYIMAGCIIEDSNMVRTSARTSAQQLNYLCITLAPNDTKGQYLEALNCSQLKDFNIIKLNSNDMINVRKAPILSDKNIIIVSKQFLQSKIDNENVQQQGENVQQQGEKVKSIAWLKKMKFQIRFIDESHYGGTTELAKNVLKYYGDGAFTIQITATYSKPINNFNIPRENWILWDLEDIKLCKELNEDNINTLCKKHGEQMQLIIEKYNTDNVIAEYQKYPELCILVDIIRPEILNEIIQSTKNNNYGWSTNACFLLKQSIKTNKDGKKEIIKKAKFQNEEENLKIWYKIFGKRNKFGIPDDEYPDDVVFMKRIEKIQNCNDDNHSEPTTILAFLPQNDIDLVSKAVIELLKTNNVIPDYEIVAINSKITNNPKQLIDDAIIQAKNNGKKGVLVLSGRQCSLATTIKSCDIVILLNNNMSFDMIYQMIFRCMTERRGKKNGFAIDFNLHRAIETSIVEYSLLVKPDMHPRDAILYLLQERIITLNCDHWMPCFGHSIAEVNVMAESIYNIYSSNVEAALNKFLDRLTFKEILLTKDEQTFFNALFGKVKPTKKQLEEIEHLLRLDDEIDHLVNNSSQLKNGIEETIVVAEEGNDAKNNDAKNNDAKNNDAKNNDAKNNDAKNNGAKDNGAKESNGAKDNGAKESDEEDIIEEQSKNKKINYMDIFRHIIPLICILTIHDENTSFVEMFEYIKEDEMKYNILIDQTKSWWGKDIDKRVLKKFINIYISHIREDKEINQIIRTVKELFIKNISNSKELSSLLDKYLIPQELEKKANAEISTPHKLRNDMLDKIPIEFWTLPHKIFEPCCGKGGFLIDIIDRFMDGLTNIKDPKERYSTIVQECLYWADINSTNVFICKLLIDPYNEYRLNYYKGNTLNVDPQAEWSLDKFDAVIGNPPYQNSNNNKGVGNTIWNLFVEKALAAWLAPNGYLLFVHPRGWRQINSKIGKLMMTRQIIYLNMNNLEKGLEVFKCSTDYDYYLIENKGVYRATIINDYNDNEYEYLINEELSFIPNHSIEKVYQIIDINNAAADNNFINDQSSYEPRKKWMSKVKTSEFKYPCVYTISAKNIISNKWSNRNDNGHFGITKFVFSNGNGYFKDIHGEYGLTQWAYAIKCDAGDIDKVEIAFNSAEFKNIIDAIHLTSNKYNYNVIKQFKKDFWKDFI